MDVFFLWIKFNWWRIDSAGAVDCVHNMDDACFFSNQSCSILPGVAVSDMVAVCAVFERFSVVPELKKIRHLADFYIFNILYLASPIFRYFSPNSST